MEYTNILNKDLRIAGIHIEDLTIQYASRFLSQWEEGARLSQLIMYYDEAADFVVLNLDNKACELLLRFTEAYLQSSKEAREEIAGEATLKSISGCLAVLDRCTKCRAVGMRAMQSDQD